MGACAILPRLIGQGRAAELLFTGRVMTAEEGERWGFHNRLVAADALLDEAMAAARAIADGPTFAHGITKTQLNMEWAVSLDVAIEMEAQAQAICMQTQDFSARVRSVRGEADAGVRGELRWRTRPCSRPAGRAPRAMPTASARAAHLIVTGGVIGWDENERLVADDIAGQFRQVLVNTLAILNEGGAGAGTYRADDVVRHRHRRVSRQPGRDRRGVSRADRAALSRRWRWSASRRWSSPAR